MARENDWVTVATFPFLGEAEVSRSFLTSLGIESQLLDTHAFGMLAAIERGGIRLLVRRDRLEEARASLEAEVSFDEEALALEAGAAGESRVPDHVIGLRSTRPVVWVLGALLLAVLLRLLTAG